MKCIRCKGNGRSVDKDGNVGLCPICNGSGVVDPTNEEWFCQLSTEEKAEWIATQCSDSIRLWRKMQYWTAHEKCKSNKWYVWLKEVHQ